MPGLVRAPEADIARRRTYNRLQATRRRRAAGVPERQMYPELRDRDWLIRMYLREYRSTKEIADILGCSPDTVRGAMRLQGISIIPYDVRRFLRAAREARGVSA